MVTPDRLSLLIVECSRSPSGSQRVIWELVSRLPRERYDVQVWLSEDPALDPLARALDEADTPLWRMPSLDERWDLRATASLWLRMRRMQPKLLHLHDGPTAPGRLKTLLASVAGESAVVVTEHRSFSPDRGASPRHRVFDRAAVVTVPCQAAADLLVRDQALERGQVRVVREGVDPTDEEHERRSACLWRQRLEAGPGRPLWVCAARHEPHKGQMVLLQALAILKERGRVFSAAFAGEGSMSRELAQRAVELGLEDDLHWLGNVDELGVLLRAASAVVVPSLWDATPRVMLEAMARERPVVASAVGGIPEMIEHGRSGLLVPAGDPDALAGALEAVEASHDRASRMGDEAAMMVREELTWARIVESYEAVYDEALGFATFVADGVAGAR